MIDELTIRSKARQFMAGLDPSRIAADLSVYTDKVKTGETAEGESGYTLTKRDGTSTIVVNELERRGRQRFFDHFHNPLGLFLRRTFSLEIVNVDQTKKFGILALLEGERLIQPAPMCASLVWSPEFPKMLRDWRMATRLGARGFVFRSIRCGMCWL